MYVFFCFFLVTVLPAAIFSYFALTTRSPLVDVH